MELYLCSSYMLSWRGQGTLYTPCHVNPRRECKMANLSDKEFVKRVGALLRPTNQLMLFSETVTYFENRTKDFQYIR